MKVVFEKERQIMMSALKTNGYVLNDGTPRSVVAQEFMNNFNIKAVDLTVSNTPAPAPATTTPATATPAAAPAPVQSKAPSQQAIELLKANKTNADVVAAFEKKYPGYRAKTYIGQ